ncbi:MAG TPA: lytic transglycosylase domain-containing protein [Xanthobacteraceae bacterium]
MRAILVFTILLLGLAGAAPEPEYSLFGGGIRADRGALDGLVEIESSTRRGDRLSLASLGPRVLRVEILRPGERDAPLRLASLNSDLDLDGANTQGDAPTTPPQPTALDNLCNTLLTSAQDNDLPVPFFANLLWQESRLRVDDISKKGAQGIAQFMPKTAVETGLANPFDPMQAIPASARFLQRLRLQFGNLGFVAAAYNAGAHRVIEWLERRANLPRETRDYVVRVTGLTVEAWKTMPIDNAALTFVPHLPCRSLPAFANVEQEQMQQTGLERAKRAPATNEEVSIRDTAVEPVIPAAVQQAGRSNHDRVREARRLTHESESSKRASKHETKQALSRIAREEHGSKHEAKHEASRMARAGRASKHEAVHAPRGGRERLRSA